MESNQNYYNKIKNLISLIRKEYDDYNEESVLHEKNKEFIKDYYVKHYGEEKAFTKKKHYGEEKAITVKNITKKKHYGGKKAITVIKNITKKKHYDKKKEFNKDYSEEKPIIVINNITKKKYYEEKKYYVNEKPKINKPVIIQCEKSDLIVEF